MSSTAHRSKPHYVYRMYNADNELLYIGCTWNLKERISGHKRNPSSLPWIHSVTRVESESYPNWFTAMQEEELQIHTRRPTWNKTLQRAEHPA